MDAQCDGAASIVAADFPDAPSQPILAVRAVVADNNQLGDLEEAHEPFDLIFAGHALCTCEWPLRPLEHVRAARGGCTEAPCTCGGVPLTREGADGFVGGISSLLARPGVAIFDQEGGWPWGIETHLRAAAAARGLHFYVRRGPMFTNFDYVLSSTPLKDDVSNDLLQRTARLTDVLLLTFPFATLALIAAAKHGDLPRELVPAAFALKQGVAVLLGLRLTLPFADVLTLSDVSARLRAVSEAMSGRMSSFSRDR